MPECRTVHDRRRSIVAAVVGNFVEFYDWTIYAVVAPLFASQIFPSESALVSLLLAFSTFALGYVARPIGAILVGVYSDRVGRRSAMTLAIVGMAVCSLVIGLTPPYATVGIAAPVTVLLARLLQGIAAGGEAGSATTYLVEFARPERRAFTACFQQMSTGLSTLCALGTVALLSAALTDVQMTAWGWRVPFIIGALLGAVGLYLRMRGQETPVFQASIARRPRREPILTSLRKAWKSVVLTSAIALLPGVCYFSWQIYLPTYIRATTSVSHADALLISVIGIVCFLLLLLPSAMLSDRYGRKPMMIGYSVAAMLWAYPTYVGLPTFANSFAGALVIALVGNVIIALMAGSLVACMAEQFQTHVRATGNGLSFALGVVISGATFPPVVTALMNSGEYHLIALYVAVAAAISLVAYIVMPETRSRDIA